MLLVLIFQSSVRSSLLILNYESEINSLQDANNLLDTIHVLYTKVSNDWPEEAYLQLAVGRYGTAVREKVLLTCFMQLRT